MLGHLGGEQLRKWLPIGLILIPVNSPRAAREEFRILGLKSVFPDDVELGRFGIERVRRVDRRLGRVGILTQRALGGADRRRRELGAALRATTGRERPAIPSAARPAAPCSTCRREARARANDSRASRCFGSIVGFESIRVPLNLPTAAWVSNSPPRPRAAVVPVDRVVRLWPRASRAGRRVPAAAPADRSRGRRNTPSPGIPAARAPGRRPRRPP